MLRGLCEHGGFPHACSECEADDLRRQLEQHEADAALGRAVRTIVEGWLVPGMTTATMPIDYLDGRHEVTKAIAEALRVDEQRKAGP